MLWRRYIASVLIGMSVLLGATSHAAAQKVGSQGGVFELTDHNGTAFASRQLAGRPYAIFFGFTHCPDVCPTTLVEMSHHLATLGADAERLRVVFVTVDPGRDTPGKLREYLASFDARIIGLTGSDADIAAVAKAWDVNRLREVEKDGSITIVHSAHVYLMDADNRLVGTLNFQEAESVQRAKLKALIAGR